MNIFYGKRFQKGIVLGLVLVMCFALAGAAYAGTSYVEYDTTVSSMGGYGYTGYQTKKTQGASGALSSQTTGGKTLKARMLDEDGDTGEWTSTFVNSEYRTLSSNDYHEANKSIRVQFKTQLSTLVQVQATGSWKSN